MGVVIKLTACSDNTGQSGMDGCGPPRSCLLYSWGGLIAANLTNMCTTACTNSLTSYWANVLQACANDVYTDTPANATDYVYGTSTLNDICNVEGVSVKPVAFADYYILNCNLNCMLDKSVKPNLRTLRPLLRPPSSSSPSSVLCPSMIIYLGAA